MDNIPEHLKPEWWDAYVGYANSLECGPDGFAADIHRDGFAAGWTLGQEADHGAADEVARLREALSAARASMPMWVSSVAIERAKKIIDEALAATSSGEEADR